MTKRAISFIIIIYACFTNLSFAVSGDISDISLSNSAESIEALQMMSSLGIMQGYGGGRLEPNDHLTRAQAAKMTYVARNGHDDNADTYKKLGFSLFDDVPEDYWGAGYVNFVALRGYAAGKGNGMFDPDGLITGFEYMKMLLGALGYDPSIEKFENNVHWKFNVINVAANAGLTKHFAGNPDTYITRSEAAMLTKNMIDSKTVSYDRNNNHILSEVSFGKIYFDLEKIIGVVAANEETDADLKGSTTIVIPDGGSGKSGTYYVSTRFEDLGMSTIIYTKGESFSNIYGTANIRPINRAVTTYASLTDGGEKQNGSLRNWLSDIGMKAGEENPVCVIKALDTPSFDGFNTNNPGEKLTAIDNNNDGIVDYMVKIIETVAVVTEKRTVGKGKVQFDSIPGNWNAENVTMFDSLSVGDVVLAYEVAGKLRVRKAEYITGEMTSCIPAYQKATINGVLLGASSLAFEDIDGSDTESTTFDQWIVDGDNFYKERIFYLDGGGNIIRISVPDEQTYRQYAYILDCATVQGTWPYFEPSAYVRLLFEDGTIGVRKVGSFNGKLVSSMTFSELKTYFDAETDHKNLMVDNVVAFLAWDSEREIGNEDGFVALSSENISSSVITGNMNFRNPNLIADSVFADNNTVYISYSQELNATKVYNGYAKIPEYAVSRGVAVHEGMIAKVVFLLSAEQVSPTSHIMLITDGPTITVSSQGEYIYTYAVFEDGKEGSISISETHSDLSPGLYTYSVSEWGEYTFEPYNDIKGTVSIVGNGIVVVDSDAYTTDDATNVYVVRSDYSVGNGKMADLAAGDNVIIVSSDGSNQYRADQIYIQSP